MKYFIATSFLVVSFLAQSQQIRDLYFNENGLSISKKEYKKRQDINKYYLLKNSTKYHIMYKRKNYGTLSNEDFKSLNTFLNNSNFKPKADFSIIQYHPGKDRCNGGNFFGNRYNRGYLKKMKRKMQFNNYWIHKKDSKLNFMQPRGIDWQLDINQIVENIFFKHHYPCSSFVIIDNRKKSYISIFGEYGDFHVIEVAEEMIIKS